jgi:hypothetical protein
VKVDVRKKSRTSSADVTQNRITSPSLRRDIPEIYGFTQVIPLFERLGTHLRMRYM